MNVPPITSRTDRENTVFMILQARIRERAAMDAEIAQLRAHLDEIRARMMARWSQGLTLRGQS